MDLITGAFAVIGTLCLVVPLLYRQLQAVEARFAAKLAQSEEACRKDLDKERATREESDRRLHQLESDFRSLLTHELAKTANAIVFVAEKIGDVVQSVDEMRAELRMRPRVKEQNSQTTVQLRALKGPKK